MKLCKEVRKIENYICQHNGSGSFSRDERFSSCRALAENNQSKENTFLLCVAPKCLIYLITAKQWHHFCVCKVWEYTINNFKSFQPIAFYIYKNYLKLSVGSRFRDFAVS